MSGPKDERGGDAFDDFFGDPTPSGQMRPAPEASQTAPIAEQHPDDEPTQDVELRRREQPTQAVRPTPVIQPEPTPHGALPESWWQADPSPAPSPAPAAGSQSTWGGAPTPGVHQHQPHQPQTHPQAPRRGLSPLAMVGMLIGGVVLGGLCVGGTAMVLSGDDEPVAQPTTITETSSVQPTTPSTTQPTSSSTSSSSSSSSSPTRSGKLPKGATKCAGPKDGVAVGRGTEVTSCAFAGAVRDAYLGATPKDGRASIEVRSPVTNKSYTMKCTGEAVTRCTGGNNAVVILY